MSTLKKVAAPAKNFAQTAVNAVVTERPSVLKEIIYGMGLGVFVGSFWKMYHINSRRRVEEFYAALEQGEVTVEAK